MSFIKQNKIKVIVMASIVLLLIANTVVNSILSSKIDEQFSDYIRKINESTDVNISYGSLSYAFLSSELSVEGFKFEDGNETSVKVDEVAVKISLSDIKSAYDSFNNGGIDEFEFTTSDSYIELENLEFTAAREKGALSFDNLSLTIGGVFTAKEQLFRSFGFSVEGFVMKEDASTLAEFSEFELFVDFGGEEVDLKSLQDNFEDITKIEEFTSTFSLKDYYLGKDVVKDLNLVIAGINSLTGDFISYEVDKDSDDIELDLDINEKSLGTVSFDSSLDISNIEDPKLDLELKLSDLKREYFDMLSQIVQMKNIGALKGDDGFEFEFKGAISELEGMFN